MLCEKHNNAGGNRGLIRSEFRTNRNTRIVKFTSSSLSFLPSSTMLRSLANVSRPRAAAHARAYATPASRIGDRKVAMSNFEKDVYINYQRIQDNLEIVRKRSVFCSLSSFFFFLLSVCTYLYTLLCTLSLLPSKKRTCLCSARSPL